MDSGSTVVHVFDTQPTPIGSVNQRFSVAATDRLNWNRRAVRPISLNHEVSLARIEFQKVVEFGVVPSEERILGPTFPRPIVP
jgi:hypothetical protein